MITPAPNARPAALDARPAPRRVRQVLVALAIVLPTGAAVAVAVPALASHHVHVASAAPMGRSW